MSERHVIVEYDSIKGVDCAVLTTRDGESFAVPFSEVDAVADGMRKLVADVEGDDL